MMQIALPQTGGCLCGEIRYEIRAQPHFAYYCHCTDCRRVSGTAFHTGLYVPPGGFAYTKGTPRTFAVTAESGRTLVREFCGTCGTGLLTPVASEAGAMSVKAGTLDDPSWVEPSLEIWTRSKLPWADRPDGLTVYEKGRT